MQIYPDPKPPKGLPRPGRVQRVNKSDGKEVDICKSAPAWQARRTEACERAGSHCERCGRFAPLHDIKDADGDKIEHYAGHAAHKDERKMGSGDRNDALHNLEWSCGWCHRSEHVPRKVVPRKPRQSACAS